MNKIKRLAGETVLYGLGNIVPRAINFPLVYIQTHGFLPDDYGIITDLYAWVSFLNVLFTFGMETTFFRFASTPGVDAQKVFNQSQTAVTIITLVVSGFLLVFSPTLAHGLGEGVAGHPKYVQWLVCVVAIDALVAIPFARLRLEKRPLKFALGKIISIFIIVSLNVCFFWEGSPLRDASMGVGYVFLFNLIGNAFCLIFFSRSLLRWRPKLDREVFRKMVPYAYPIMLMGLAGMTNEMFSRLTLHWWLPENFYPGKRTIYVLGIFGACYKYGMFMSLAIQAFRYAAEPFFFSNAAEKNSADLFARVNHYFIITCCLLLLGVSLNIDILKYLIDESYWEGLHIVPILLTAYMFMGIYYNLTVWFKLTDKTYWGTVITVGGAVVTIVANYLLIPVAGYEGSSWATLLCYFSMMVSCYLLGQRYYPIPYHVKSGAAYILVTILLVYSVKLLNIHTEPLATGLHVVIILVYIFIVYLIERRGLQKIRLKEAR